MVPGHTTNAGEMNGFLKTSDSLLHKPLVVEGNAIKLDSNFRPALASFFQPGGSQRSLRRGGV